MTEAITLALLVSELIGERDNQPNYKYGRMCSRAGREAGEIEKIHPHGN